MKEIINIIFGDYSLTQLFGYIWFFIIGYLIYGLNETTGRDIKSKKTPEKWSWKFWFHDNWKRYLTTILCTYILFRFYSEMCGHELSYYDMLGIGIIGDGLAATLKKRVSLIGVDRQKLMEDSATSNSENNNVNNNEVG